MNEYRKYARTAGVLFIIATVASLLASALIKPILSDPDHLARIAGNGTPMYVGALLKFVTAAASAGIALALYPVLRKYNEGLAIGSVALRLVEGSFYAVGAAGPLLLVTLSQDAAKAGAADASYFEHSAALLVAGCDWLGFVAAVLFFGLGALLYYSALYQSELVPRWLSGWGIAGAVLAMVAATAVMFQFASPMSTVHILLNLPIGLQEMVLAVWLIARGLNPRAAASKAADEASPADATSTAGAPAQPAGAAAISAGVLS